MTNEEIKERIAIELGWTAVGIGATRGVPPGKPVCERDNLPNWMADLNACHEMEKHLGNDLEGKSYIATLAKIATREEEWPTFSQHFFKLIHATAAQRLTLLARNC